MELTKPTPTAQSAPAHQKAVNDVSAPVTATPASPPPASDTPADLSVHEPSTSADEPHAKKPEKKDVKKVIQPKPQHTGSHGTGMAIFAAVIIVLGLGAMMTYAYLRSQNISLF